MTEGEPRETTVVHVDDDPHFAELVALQLERRLSAATVETFARPAAVLDRLDAGGVDCIVSDYQMPETDGLELLETVRERSDVPFVLLTGHGSESVASDAIAAGVTDYVRKGAGDDQWLLLANRVRRAVREHRALAARAEADRRFNTLIRAMPGIAYRSPLERGWPIDFVSEGCLELTGYEPSTLESGAVRWGADVVHPDHRGDGWDDIVAAVEAGERYDRTYRIRTRTGETRWVRDQGLGVTDGDGDGVVAVEGYVFDVTDEHRRGTELRDKESLLDSLFADLPVHLFAKDAAARHVRVSEALVDDPAVFAGKTDLELHSTASETHRRRAYEDDRRVIETGEAVLDKEEYLPRLDRWNRTSKVPWTDDEGDVVGLIGISWDVTERKRRRREILRQNERLEEFAGVVSHDVRNPLGVARGNLELLGDDVDDDRLDVAVDALDRIDAIVDDVLSMARDGSNVLDRRRVSLAEAAATAWECVETEAATLRTPDPLGTVHCDRARLVRLLENLFRNAVEHGSTGGDDGPTVTVRRLDDEVGFVVTDDGPGVPEAARETAFERGYTTDADGTGYGLAIVAEIVDAHGWSVRLGEASSGGARVEVVTGHGLGPDGDAQSNSTSDD